MAKCEGVVFYIWEVYFKVTSDLQLPLCQTESNWQQQMETAVWDGRPIDLILSVCSATLQGRAQDADVEGHGKQLQNVSD